MSVRDLVVVEVSAAGAQLGSGKTEGLVQKAGTPRRPISGGVKHQEQ